MDTTTPNIVGSCCIGFHVVKILTDFKLCRTTSNGVCMQLMDATCNIQQCCMFARGLRETTNLLQKCRFAGIFLAVRKDEPMLFPQEGSG